MTTSLTFQTTTFDVIDRNGHLWVKSSQLATALGYSSERSVSNLYARNSDEFTNEMSVVINLSTGGVQSETRIFSLRGCHLLAMFARTAVAKAFRVWVLDVLESLNKPTPSLSTPDAPITPDQQKTLQDIVKAKVEALPEDQRHGGLYPQAWTRFKNHFRIPRYNELPQSRMSDAVAYLMHMELRQASLPTPKRKALPASSHPAQAKADALLAKVKFFIGEIDDIGTQVQEMLAREHFRANPDAVHDLRDTRSRMNAHVSCTTRFLWSSVNSTLSAVEDSIKLRLENSM